MFPAINPRIVNKSAYFFRHVSVRHVTYSFIYNMPSKDKYTDPKLRDEVKEELKESDKGGRPGQWSARKAQMMAKEYKNRGGDYNTDKSEKDESQKNLSSWGDEEWQTKEGSGDAKQKDGSMKRYLPKKAWEKMSEQEKKETDEKKQEEDKEGKQFVGNTDKAKKARKQSSKNESKNDNKDDDKKESDEEEDTSKSSEDEEKQTSEKEDEKPSTSRRSQRKRTRKQDDEEKTDQNTKADNKKQKNNDGTASSKGKGGKSSKGTVGSKHDSSEAPAQQASADRLPKKGQKAHWKALPGWVEGEVVEIVKSKKDVDGKQIKASKDDPRIVLKSKSSGKICVHKPDNVYFD